MPILKSTAKKQATAKAVARFEQSSDLSDMREILADFYAADPKANAEAYRTATMVYVRYYERRLTLEQAKAAIAEAFGVAPAEEEAVVEEEVPA